MTGQSIRQELARLGCEIDVIFYENTDSTNQRAKEYALARGREERSPVLFVANAQTAGRGRRGRSFISNDGAGIYMSLLLYPEKLGKDTTALTARAAVAISRAIEACSVLRPRIKWVNDVFVGGKKLAGVLCEGELASDGNFNYFIVGMGINVYKNAISEEISTIATSLEGEGCPIGRAELCAGIISELVRADFDLYEEYKSRSLVIGRSVTVQKLTESYPARVLDLNRDFSLQIIREDGNKERLVTGELSLKI